MAPLPETSESARGSSHKSYVNKDDVSAVREGVRYFTWEEVAKHNTETDCWVTVHDKVYDITSWMDRHPGGKEILRLAAGRNISEAFESYHPFTNKAHEVLAKYEIGAVSSYEFPPYIRDQGFYKDLCQAVSDYFKREKLDPKSPIGGLLRMAVVMTVALLTNFLAFGPLSLSFLPRLFFAIIFGLCQALPLLHVMHDCSHTSFGHTQTWWRFWGRLFMDFYVGCSMTSWHNQHTMGHHIYSNVFQADPDLPKDDKGDLRRLVKAQTWRPFVQYQHLYMPCLYGLLGITMRFADIVGRLSTHSYLY